MVKKPSVKHKIHITPYTTGYRVCFDAMASPCEILLESDDKKRVEQIAQHVCQETWRIENKYSRYKPSSLCSKINLSAGKNITIDDETYQLLSFAEQCYNLSEGRFDITSGVLRKAWHFDGSDNIPNTKQIEQIMPHIGWEKVHFNQQHIHLPQGMEIDFGGIGKEYAVDKAIQVIQAQTNSPALVNFGGDLAVTKPRDSGQPWQVGIDLIGLKNKPHVVIAFHQGAIATSGDANRFLLKNNKRYSHILNPKTGWPVENAPSSVTVAANTCVNAGIVATLAMLQGEQAETFLQENQFKHWLYRDTQ